MNQFLSKIIKSFVLFIFIFGILINNFSTISFGSQLSGLTGGLGNIVRGEVGPKVPRENYDAPSTPIPGGKKEEKKETPPKKEEKPDYSFINGISGKAIEQFLKKAEGNVVGSQNTKTKNIRNVKVDILSGNSVVKTLYTNENGDFDFGKTNGNNGVLLDPGTYKLRFTYGANDNVDDVENLKSNLKYNGIDYSAIATGKVHQVNKLYTNESQKEILIKGPAATEIILVIDCSTSATTTVVKEENGVKYTRLDVQKEAAKQLIEKLLAKQSVYIGIVCFAGPQSAYRAISQTNDKDLLFETLDEIKEDGKCSYKELPGGTDIYNAIEKADTSYVSDETNKWLVLLSDGAPTAATSSKLMENGVIITAEDTYDEKVLLSKFENIVNYTKKYLNDLMDKKKINICSYIVKSDVEAENALVEMLFNTSPVKGKLSFFTSTDDEAANYIKDKIFKKIEEQTEATEKVTTEKESVKILGSQTWNFDGVEDKERREKVNKDFSTYNYQIGQQIEDVLYTDNFNDENLKNEAKDFLNKSYMTVTMTDEIKVDKVKSEDDDNWYLELAGAVSKTQYKNVVGTNYNAVLGLFEREKLDVDVSVKATGFKLTLANGMTQNQIVTDGTVDKDLNVGQNVKDIKEISDSVFIQSLEKDLIYGSRIDIEYTIVLKNVSTVPVSDVTIIDYLADFSGDDYDAKRLLSYDENNTMLSSSFKNKDYGWKIVEKEELKGKVSDETFDKMDNGYYIYLNTKDSPLLRNKDSHGNQLQIGANGERYIKLILTKTLSTKKEDLDAVFCNSAEILDYTNKYGIRMRRDFKNSDSGAEEQIAIVSGNSLKGNAKPIVEPDYDQSIDIVLVPPTGKIVSIIIIIVTFAMFLTAVFIFNSGKLKLKLRKKKEQNEE